MRRSRLIIHRSFASEHAAGQQRRAGAAEVTVAIAAVAAIRYHKLSLNLCCGPFIPT